MDEHEKQQVNEAKEAVDKLQENEEVVVDVSSNVTDAGVPKRRKKHLSKKKILTFVGILVVVIAAIASWCVLRHMYPPVTSVIDKDVQTKGATKNIDSDLERFLHPTTGETWLAKPEKLAKQGFYSEPDGGTEMTVDEDTGEEYEVTHSDIDYWEVGSRNGNTIVLARKDVFMGAYELFEKTKDGKVSLIAKPQRESESFAEQDFYRKGVTIDKKTHYDSLSLPKSVTLDDGIVLKRPDYVDFGRLVDEQSASSGETRKKVQTLGGSTIYRTESVYTDTKLTDVGYIIETPMHTEYDLVYGLDRKNNELSWLGAPKVDEENKDAEYIKPITRGCGIGERLTRSDTLKASDLQLFKTSPSGEKVYVIKDKDNVLLAKAYDEFKEYVKSDPENKYAKLTKVQFIAANAVMIYPDKKGENFVYVRTDMAPSMGCAKPVVYLYPENTTRVNVKVGADVKISEPHYNAKTGWNVVAQPDGQLNIKGANYDSLFWEGPGIGRYPAIVSGTVVERSQAIATIRIQLVQQGFNQKEIADFVEYWHDKLPNKPYIRLTWLTTEQMNHLAPLQVLPKPDTVIRTFLDFSGYDTPISIAPQTFRAPVRHGFTVTEWGGLSPYKLY